MNGFGVAIFWFWKTFLKTLESEHDSCDECPKNENKCETFIFVWNSIKTAYEHITIYNFFTSFWIYFCTI